MTHDHIIRNVHWLGHDSFRLDGSKVVAFDPYELSKPFAADIICITHEHFDHCSPPDVAKIQKSDTVIVTDAASAKKLSGEVRIVKPGDRIEVSGVSIEVVPAYNTNKKFHPKSAGMLGFVVTLDGVRHYHAGDTDFIPEMETLDVDVAFLPVSGTYVMDVEEAVQAARAIRPKVAIPMHYGAIVGSSEDAKRFQELLAGAVPVVVLPKEG